VSQPAWQWTSKRSSASFSEREGWTSGCDGHRATAPPVAVWTPSRRGSRSSILTLPSLGLEMSANLGTPMNRVYAGGIASRSSSSVIQSMLHGARPVFASLSSAQSRTRARFHSGSPHPG
jgi:hypothetical protein